jgi:Domain of unknown function (DUF6268)
MKYRTCYIFLFLLASTLTSWAQSQIDSLYQAGICDDNGFCIPQLPGLPRPKGVVLDFNWTNGQSIESEYADSNVSGKIRQSTRLKFKLRLPVVLKDGIKVIVGAEYKLDEYRFDKTSISNSALFDTLNGRQLKTIGSSVYVVKPFKGNNYILGRLKLKVSGDLAHKDLDDYFRSSLSVIYGKRANMNVSWGFGLNYNYSFGKQFVLPVFAYSKRISDNWSMEALLPITVKLRYNFDDKNILEFTNKLTGDGYNIAFKNMEGDNLFMEKSDLLTSLVFEREIHDFLWVSTSVGHRLNVKFDLSDKSVFPSNKNNKRPMIKNQVSNTLFVGVSLFLVPPRKWTNK